MASKKNQTLSPVDYVMLKKGYLVIRFNCHVTNRHEYNSKDAKMQESLGQIKQKMFDTIWENFPGGDTWDLELGKSNAGLEHDDSFVFCHKEFKGEIDPKPRSTRHRHTKVTVSRTADGSARWQSQIPEGPEADDVDYQTRSVKKVLPARKAKQAVNNQALRDWSSGQAVHAYEPQKAAPEWSPQNPVGLSTPPPDGAPVNPQLPQLPQKTQKTQKTGWFG